MGKNTVAWDTLTWQDWQRLTDGEIAIQLDCARGTVTAYRAKHSLPRPRRRYRLLNRKPALAKVMFTLPHEMLARLRAAAQAGNTTMSALAREFIAAGLPGAETNG